MNNFYVVTFEGNVYFNSFSAAEKRYDELTEKGELAILKKNYSGRKSGIALTNKGFNRYFHDTRVS